MLEHLLDQAHQIGFVKRLLDEIHGAFFHGVHRHGHIAVAGDKHDGQGRANLDQPRLQLQAGHAAHADVYQKAGHFARVVAAEEGFGRIKATHPVAFALEQPLQRIAHRLVVVDDVDSAFFGDQTRGGILHCVSRLLQLCFLVSGLVYASGSQKVNLHPVIAPSL